MTFRKGSRYADAARFAPDDAGQVPFAGVRARSIGPATPVIEHEVTGLLAPVGDASALAAAIDRLLDDPALARRLAAAARERVRAFDVRRTVEATEAVYLELVD